ncbi:hypothetical protein [Novosphingobium sp. ST904]|uniref:hypothetical protein n=1 Tax=Novosphingobium sp. ST904 TaxID=1684385 RepID=UPI0012E1BE90|nr:hypothetical protein [Novosphingobium sp. ST904]
MAPETGETPAGTMPKKFETCGRLASTSFVDVPPDTFDCSSVIPTTFEPAGAIPRIRVPVTTISLSPEAFGCASSSWAKAHAGSSDTAATPAARVNLRARKLVGNINSLSLRLDLFRTL